MPGVSEIARKGLLNTVSVEGSPFLFSGHDDGYRNARLSRVLFLLIVGLGPCFPAMIHIDIAGTLYAGKNKKATERVKEWREELKHLQFFCFRYRASLERFMLRVEHLVNEDEQIFKDHVKGASLPDWSFSSFGIEGRRGMKQRCWEGFAHEPGLVELLTGEVRPKKFEPRNESSLFRDAEGYLNNAQHFLSLIGEVVKECNGTAGGVQGASETEA